MNLADPRFRIDATKLQDYISCERSFFFRHWLGWQSLGQLDLIFGQAWHEAMAAFLPRNAKPDYSRVSEALQAFESIYDQHYSLADEETNAPKNKENALRAMMQYASNWYADSFIVRHVEASGVCYAAADAPMYFKIDAICEDSDGRLFVLEHKTTKRNFDAKWQMSWQLKTQIGVYANALLSLQERDCADVRINGIRICNAPKFKKDGTPYANARDTEFLRVSILKTQDEMEIWRLSTLHHYYNLRRELETIAEHEERFLDCVDLPVFPMRTEYCANYSGCPYHSYCRLRRNPLRFAKDFGTPVEFEQRIWDPLQEYESAKEKLS